MLWQWETHLHQQCRGPVISCESAVEKSAGVFIMTHRALKFIDRIARASLANANIRTALLCPMRDYYAHGRGP